MAESPIKRRFVGRNPRRTALQLIIASIAVGAFLAFWGVSPGQFWRGVFDVVKGVFSWLGDSVGEIALNLSTYLLFGAAIVVPVWLIGRLLSDRRSNSDR